MVDGCWCVVVLVWFATGYNPVRLHELLFSIGHVGQFDTPIKKG